MAKKRSSRLTAARTIVERQDARRVPSVNAVDPEVRTDSSIPITPPEDNVKDLNELIKSGAAIGAYVVEWGYDVPEAKWAEFHKWLAGNERTLAAKAPSGVLYKGTVVAVFGPLHRPDGRYRTFWALGALQDAQRFWVTGDATFKNLVQQLLSFRDRASGTGFSQLYRTAAGSPVY
jgi:hypothetical protein